MTRVRDLSMEVPSLLLPNGKPPIDTWSFFETFSKADKVDPTAGIKLMSPGEAADFWVPPSLPDGFTRAMRHSPTPAQRALGLTAYRPRSQAVLSRSEFVDAAAVKAGLPADQPADGAMGLTRVMQTYLLIPPGDEFHIPTENPASGGANGTILNGWHGQSLKGKQIGKPTLQFQVNRYPDTSAPERLTAQLAGGRYKIQKIFYSSGAVEFPEPDWPWDDLIVPYVTSPGVLAYVESSKEFDLLDGAPLERAKWYKIVIHQHYHWDGTQALTEVWIDGIKRIGLGGTNTIISTPRMGGERIVQPPSPPDELPNLWIEPTGLVQQMRFEQTMYEYSEDPAVAKNKGWYDPALWDKYMWTRAIWYCGTQIFDTILDVNPLLPASVEPPEARQSWQIIGPPTRQELVNAPEAVQTWNIAEQEVVVGRERVWAKADPAAKPGTMSLRTSDGDWVNLK